jgi:hypothetical protein
MTEHESMTTAQILSSRHVTAASPHVASRWRVTLGFVFLLHAMAHSNASTWAGDHEPVWLVTTLWSAALLGYLIAGFGILGVPLASRWWAHAMAIAMGTSIALLAMVGGPIAWWGIALDAGVLVLLLRWASLPVSNSHASGWLSRRRRVAHAVALTVMAYATVVVLFRPIYTQWGTTAGERTMLLPGDELVADPRYRVDHGVTIQAPADSVWPWLMQLGQDRGGFYSHDWLERLFGDNVHNASRIHPEWQSLRIGDRIRAAQPDYLGGKFGQLGWKVLDVRPGRAFVLEGWGAFVLVPVNDSTTRFLIRTRGDGRPSLIGVLLGPVSVFVFEPAHFIMQRAMMFGIRDRAEQMLRPGD